MKTGRIFWGVGCILAAIIFILDAVGVMIPFMSAVGEISVLSAVLGLLFVSYAVARLLKGKISEIFIPLAAVFIIFEKNIAFLCGREDPNLINNWLLLGCAILLSIGFRILFPSTGEHEHFNINVNTNSSSHQPLSSHFTSKVEYIDASDFQYRLAENNLGSLTINFANADRYKGGGELYVENDLGSIVINVPSSWQFTHSIKNDLGSIKAAAQNANANAPLLVIKGKNDLGSIVINRV